ncbi:MAG TPA: heavy metal-binding domain-containing protein [Pyrinomonadaceae bacterium]
MAKNILTVIASGVAVIITLAFVEPPSASAIEDGQQGDRHAHSRRHRVVRKKAVRRRATGYVCPMHPDMRSNAPGTCPKCLMELERKDAKPSKRK